MGESGEKKIEGYRIVVLSIFRLRHRLHVTQLI